MVVLDSLMLSGRGGEVVLYLVTLSDTGGFGVFEFMTNGVKLV